MKKLHLIAGFPRSGSTLLCQILNMNPDFKSTPTSPLLDCILSQHATFSHNGTFKSLNRLELYNNYAEAQKSFIKSLYNQDKVYFDKNRNWTAHLSKIDEILDNDETKIIWTYRNPLDVISSIESWHRKFPILQFSDEINNQGVYNTLESRISTWISQNGIIGSAFNLLIDAIDMGYGDRILFVDYKDLCIKTQETMNLIHEFIGEKTYNYSKNNFKDLKQTTHENDSLYNYKFTHEIKEGGIEYKESDLELPKKYYDLIDNRFKYVNDLVRNQKSKNVKRSSRKNKLQKA